eukprot:5722850-Pleurochrysis_carterae.AAC.1
MAMPSEGCCAGAMALSAARSVHMTDLVAAVVIGPRGVCACKRRNDAEEVRLPLVRGRGRRVDDVNGHSIYLSLAGKVGGVIVVEVAVGDTSTVHRYGRGATS